MSHGKFGTAVNCMDGRVQLPVMNWMKEQFHLDYVDMITEPGPDKTIAEGQSAAIEAIKGRAAISARAHGSRVIVIAGHNDCAGNPVAREIHHSQIRESVKLLRSWGLPFDEVVGVWVNEDWGIEVVHPPEG